MLVIMDMEWVTRSGKCCPTQISAVRLTRDWQEDGRFDRLICPEPAEMYSPDHMAFTGYSRGQFLDAADAASVLSLLSRWVRPDDSLCWWSAPTAATFAAVWKDTFQADPPFPLCLISGALQNGLHRFRLPLSGSVYKIVEAAGIPACGCEHCSADDADMICALLRFLRPNQNNIRHNLLPNGAVGKILREVYRKYDDIEEGEYVVDLSHQIAHRSSCDLIPANCRRKFFSTLEGTIRSLALPCSCIEEEYWQFSHARAEENIRKMNLRYIYSEKSGVFHRPSCDFVRYIPFPEIHGCGRYETAVSHGLMPCYSCKPHLADRRREVHNRKDTSVSEVCSVSADNRSVKCGRQLNRHERNAVKRHEQAVRERAVMPRGLEGTDSHDALVLSASGFAFWAAEGYQTFHLHDCPKLNGLSGLRGFSRFSDACRAGLKPCRICRPSEKADILASVPLEQRVRTDETIEQIDAFCDWQGWKHEKREDGYYIETPAAKWMLKAGSWPMAVFHMPNGSGDYHRQHRTFLSMTDTVEYIRQHDRNTVKDEGKDLESMLRDVRRDHEEKIRGMSKKALFR